MSARCATRRASIHAWGRNDKGQVGDGTLLDRLTAVPVVHEDGTSVSDIAMVAAGSYHSLADGTLLAWGENGYGQLGDGTTTRRKNPVIANGSGAQLAVVLTDDPDPVAAATALTLTANVTNLGRSTATAVTVDTELAGGGTVGSASGSGWSCTTTDTSVHCTAASLTLGPAPPIAIEITAPSEAGTLTHTATVAAAEADPRSADNSASAETTVRPVADLALAILDLPGVVTRDFSFGYTMSLTNLGPSTATGIRLLPAGAVDLLSVVPSQGSCTTPPAITCDLGTLLPGASATVAFEAVASALGALELQATVTASEDDPVAENNTATAPTLVTRDGLAGYWPFDEEAGDVALDATGRGNDGTIYGAVRTAGVSGGALDFNGDSNRVQLPGDMSHYVEDHFTVAMWINVTEAKTYNYVFHDRDNYPGLRVDGDNRLVLLFKPNPSMPPLPGEPPQVISEPLPLGEWVHVAARWDGTGYSGFVNGHGIGTQELPYFNFGNRLLIGSDGVPERSFEGLIEEVRIYNRALSDREIQAIATVLGGYWKFDEVDGEIALDSSGNRNAGEIRNHSGELWQRTGGVIGSALDLKGTNYVAIPDDGSLSITGPLTVEAWVTLRSSPSRIVHKTAWFSNNQDNYTLGSNVDGNFLFHLEDSADGSDYSVVSITEAQPGVWYHVAGVFAGEQLLIYVNGALENTRTIGPVVPYTGTADLILGTNQFSTHGNKYWTDGVLDEVRIHRRALSAEEIALHAEATVGYWRFDEPGGERVLDSSGNFNDGVAVNQSGTPWQRLHGVAGRGFHFTDGLNYIAIRDAGSLSLTGPQTVQAWMKLVESPSRMIYKTSSTSANRDNYMLGTNDLGQFRFHMENSANDNDYSANSTTRACALRWYHVAGIYDGTAMTIYVDGVLEDTRSTGPFVPYTGDADLVLGTNALAQTNSVWSNGLLDEVRIHARALLPAEIAARAAEGPVYPPPSGEIASPTGAVEGDVTVEASASDVDGLAEVSVTFVEGATPLVLCSDSDADPCPTDAGSWTVPGVDPRDYGVAAAGQVRLVLAVRDECDHLVEVATQSFDWTPPNSPASGAILQPAGPMVGAITVEATASDADGLSRVYATFVEGEAQLVLCDDATASPCPAVSGAWLVGDVDPEAYGVAAAGTVTLRLWVRDERGVVAEVAVRPFDWQPLADAACIDNLECGTGNWRTGPGPADGGTEPWYLTDADSHSPSRSLGVAGEPGTKDQLLQVTSMEVPADALSFELRFWHRMSTTGMQDGGVLEYSVDGGTTWFDILEGDGAGIPANPNRFLAGGYNTTLACCGAPLSERGAWSGTSGWQQVTVELADFAGCTVRLRWRFGAMNSAPDEGWRIDDVELVEAPACPLKTIFADGFESGDVSVWSATVP